MTEREALTEHEALQRLIRAALEYCHWVRNTPTPEVGPERELRLAAFAYGRAMAPRLHQELDWLFAEFEASQERNPDASAVRKSE